MNADGDTALHVFVGRCGATDAYADGAALAVLSFLVIDCKLEVNARGGLLGHTALHVACARRWEAGFERLLNLGSKLDILDGRGRTPLHR